jgi:glutathione S-transferase
MWRSHLSQAAGPPKAKKYRFSPRAFYQYLTAFACTSPVTTALAMVDQVMAVKTWANGETFTMADCSAGPALFYATRSCRSARGIRMPPHI